MNMSFGFTKNAAERFQAALTKGTSLAPEKDAWGPDELLTLAGACARLAFDQAAQEAAGRVHHSERMEAVRETLAGETLAAVSHVSILCEMITAGTYDQHLSPKLAVLIQQSGDRFEAVNINMEPQPALEELLEQEPPTPQEIPADEKEPKPRRNRRRKDLAP